MVEGTGVIGYVYTFDDLTMLKRLEREVRLRDRLAAVGRLAAGIAHEIRNPLSSIAGSVKLLASLAALNEDQRTLVDIVTRESDRLSSIIGDFLTYSREKKYQMRTVDLVLLLDDTLTLLEHVPDRRVRSAAQLRRRTCLHHRRCRQVEAGVLERLQQRLAGHPAESRRRFFLRYADRRAEGERAELDAELLR